MANENAIQDISLIETTAKCPGCDKPLNLLTNHLVVSGKVQRNVLVTVDAADVDTEEAQKLAKNSEDGQTEMYFLGTRSGAGEQWTVHDWDCLFAALKDRKGKDLKFKLHVGDPGDDK